MKILVVSHYYESHRGGVEIVAGNLARGLIDLGFDVTWAASDASPPPPVERLRRTPLRAINSIEHRWGVPVPIPLPSAWLALSRAVREADAVLIHDCLYLTSLLGLIAAKIYRRPALIVQHVGNMHYNNPALRQFVAVANQVVARTMLARTERVMFMSQSTQSYFEGVKFKTAPSIVFYGVDTNIFSPGEKGSSGAARREFGLAQDRRIALFVGRFLENKGLEVLHESARMQPDIDFVFAGGGPIDPRGWGLPNVAVFNDLDASSLVKLYRAADVFVLPSFSEGFSLVVREALACGLKVICSTDCVIADEGARPFLIEVDVRDNRVQPSEKVSAALDEALALEVDDAVERFEYAKTHYSWPRAAAVCAAMLNGLVNSRGA